MSDADFTQFTKWLDTKDYAYKSETELQLDSLKAIAVKEKYFDNAKAEFEALKNKLSHDKKQDLLKNKDQVKHMLEAEIASRYYFMRGRMAQSMQYDKELDKAIAVITNPTEYNALLKKPAK